MSLNWYPIINLELCTSCGICYEFCSHGVYELNGGTPFVIEPEGCIQGCHGCENKCPSGAIHYYGDLPGKKTGCTYCLDLNL